MMLLTAFVLVIGFVVLSGMVARVTQLPEETRQSVDRPIYTESDAVARGVKAMLERLDELNAVDEENMVGYPEDLAEFSREGANHLERLESARGFRLRFIGDPAVACDDSGSDVLIATSFALSDVQTRIQFTVTFAIPPAADGPIDPDSDPTAYVNCDGTP